MIAIGRQPHTAVASFSSVIGSLGGECGSRDISLQVPAGAVSVATQFSGQVFLDSHLMPPTDSTKEEIVLSPLVVLCPSHVQFSENVRLVLPVSVPYAAVSKQHGSGWLMELKMCTTSYDEKSDGGEWYTALAFNTVTGEVITRSSSVSFDPHHGIISLQHFCSLCWLGHLLGIQSWVERTVCYAVFGKRLQHHKWMVYVHIIHGTDVVFEELVHTTEKQSYVLLHPARTATIGRCGHVHLTAECEAPWKLCRGPADAQIPTKQIWNSPINRSSYFAFTIEDPTTRFECFECRVTATFIGDWAEVEPVTLAVANALDSGLPCSPPAASHNTNMTFINSRGLAFGANSQIAMAVAAPDVDIQHVGKRGCEAC